MKKRTARSPARPSARQRILDTADRLFYAEGLRAVGIDRIIAEAEVAKMTLYNHFKSKDELITAVLQQREADVVALFEKNIDRHERLGKDRLEAFFLALRDWFRSRGYRGCSFINATVELADQTHPGSMFAQAHKRRFFDMVSQIVVESRGEQAERLVPAICLIVEGAIIRSVMGDRAKAADTAWEAVSRLLPK
ncbi:MAG: TetR/AcrR family transcriptional regulator [Planctomycetaceae bacterium]|nr:TetR/AcrR family transcriptional regulator [Planctomycetaceae bacterium]